MRIYLDNDYKCYVSPEKGNMSVETEFFDGKCQRFVEGYRFVPEGHTWTRPDGMTFYGQMISPWRPFEVLAELQAQWEEQQAEIEALAAENEDKTAALAAIYEGATE